MNNRESYVFDNVFLDPYNSIEDSNLGSVSICYSYRDSEPYTIGFWIRIYKKKQFFYSTYIIVFICP